MNEKNSGSWNVAGMLEWATGYFEQKKVPSPRLSIEWLLSDVLGIKRLDLYLQFDRPLSKKELDKLRPLIRRRARHEPLQYITGSTSFHDVEIKVTPHTLIPRPETEQLVEIILEEQNEAGTRRLLDIGTGSGCIAVALKKARPHWQVDALDISSEALETARENARNNQTAIHFLQGDYHTPAKLSLEHDYDLVVSNPPYITADEHKTTEKQVRDYEPPLALFTRDVQRTYSEIVALASDLLVTGGALYMETGDLHAENLLRIFNPDQWDAVILPDYSGKKRFLKGCLR